MFVLLMLMPMRKSEQRKTNKWVRSSYVSVYAYAYVADGLTCYAYVTLMHFALILRLVCIPATCRVIISRSAAAVIVSRPRALFRYLLHSSFKTRTIDVIPYESCRAERLHNPHLSSLTMFS